MQAQLHDDPRLVAAAERQMRSWSRVAEAAGRAPDTQPTVACRRDYVAISRETGAGGGRIAAALGQRLGWDVWNRELLDRMAERFGESRAVLDVVDETGGNWAYDVLGSWMDQHIVPHMRYLAQLRQVIRWAARRGRAVFVGRGAQFLLPRAHCLAVRVIAPQKFRVAQVMRTHSLGPSEAQRLLEQTDRSHREFLAEYFHRDAADPHLYDLVLNTERLGEDQAVRQIAAALCR